MITTNQFTISNVEYVKDCMGKSITRLVVSSDSPNTTTFEVMDYLDSTFKSDNFVSKVIPDNNEDFTPYFACDIVGHIKNIK